MKKQVSKKATTLSPKMVTFFNLFNEGSLVIDNAITDSLKYSFAHDIISQLPKINHRRLVNRLRSETIISLGSTLEIDEIWKCVLICSRFKDASLDPDLSESYENLIDNFKRVVLDLILLVYKDLYQNLLAAFATSDQPKDIFIKDYLIKYGEGKERKVEMSI